MEDERDKTNNGKVRSKRGLEPNAACGLVWESPSIGSKIMIDITRGKPKAIEKAVIKGKLMLEGDAASIKWFFGLLLCFYKIIKFHLDIEIALS